MAIHPSGPVQDPERIVSLDLIRGVAVLGILLMNAVPFRLGDDPYFNLYAGTHQTWIDWAVGIFGEIFIDQKFMGLFSLLIGILHSVLWSGDVLTAYAVSSIVLIALRKQPNWTLVSVGIVAFALSIVYALLAQYVADMTNTSLAGFWTPVEISSESALFLPFLLGFVLRALGLMLIGTALYRTGFMNGDLPARTYRLTAIIGLAVGLPLAAAGVMVTAANEIFAWSRLHRSDSQHA